MKKFLLVLAVILTCSPFAVMAETVDKIVAKVGADVITQSDLNVAMKAKKQFLNESFGPREGGKQFQDFKANALNEMVLQKVLESEIKHENIVIADSDVDREYGNRVRASRRSEPEFISDLATFGLSLKDYKENIRKELSRQKFIEKKIMPLVIVSDEDLQKEYEKHKNEYLTYKKIHFIEVLLTPDKFASRDDVVAMANEIHDKLSHKQSVSALVKQYSSGIFAAQGGDSGLIDATTLREELRQILSSLKPGETSQILPTNQGVFIFKLLAKAAPEPLPFSAVLGAVRNRYADQVVQEQLKNYLLAIKEKMYVEFLP